MTLQDIIAQLSGQAQPRPDLMAEGKPYTYAGRVGTGPMKLSDIIAQLPAESPDAEGVSGFGGALAGGVKIFKPGPSQATRTIGNKTFKDKITQWFDAPPDAVPDMPFHQMPAAVKNMKTGEIISSGARDIASINNGMAHHSYLRSLIPQGAGVTEGFVDPKTGFFYPRDFIENTEQAGIRLMQRYAK